MPSSRISLDRVSGPIWILATLLAKTWRIRFSGSSSANPFLSPVKPRVFCFWHTSILPVFYLGSRANLTALISGSRDGERLSAVLQRWGYEMIRGSSSKEGSLALRECVRAVNEGCSVILTPDGPRGPARQMKKGAVLISLITGVPLVPVACSASVSRRLNSWDRFTIPLPFSEIRITTAEPIDPAGFKDSPDAVKLMIETAEKGMNLT